MTGPAASDLVSKSSAATVGVRRPARRRASAASPLRDVPAALGPWAL